MSSLHTMKEGLEAYYGKTFIIEIDAPTRGDEGLNWLDVRFKDEHVAVASWEPGDKFSVSSAIELENVEAIPFDNEMEYSGNDYSEAFDRIHQIVRDWIVLKWLHSLDTKGAS